MKSHYELSEKITALRLTASVIYDRGKALGQSPSEIADAVRPLTQALDTLVAQAVTDLPNMVTAIHHLETQAAAFKESAHFFTVKSNDTLHHADRLREALLGYMKAEGLTQWESAGFCAALVRVSGEDQLTLR